MPGSNNTQYYKIFTKIAQNKALKKKKKIPMSVARELIPLVNNLLNPHIIIIITIIINI